jgi:signal transduction histidine kinase
VRFPSTLRWRLTLWYIVLLGVPLVGFAVGGYLLVERTLAARTDRFIADALVPFSREIVAERRVAAGVLPAIRTTANEVRFGDLHIAVLDSTGFEIASTPGLSGREREHEDANTRLWIGNALRGRNPAGSDTITVAEEGVRYRIIATPLIIEGQRFTLAGAYALTATDNVLALVRHVFAIAIPLLIAAAAIGGYAVTSRSLAPVSRMAERAGAISSATLGERLPVRGSEEVVRLAEVVNGLLDRLEKSFDQQKRFMADASHELRTPTAIIRTEADVTLAQGHRDEPEYRASIQVMRDAAQRLARIVDDLFLLARSDASAMPLQRQPVHLDEVIQDAIRAIHPLAAARGIRVDLAEFVEAPFEGDAGQLDRLVLNLLHNAIKHSPRDQTIEVSLSRPIGQSRYEIRVIDSGGGIPLEAQPRIFERFFRVDTSRAAANEEPSSPTAGAGLGLAIAQRIAELHGGSVGLVASRPGRTEFIATLPANSA